MEPAVRLGADPATVGSELADAVRVTGLVAAMIWEEGIGRASALPPTPISTFEAARATEARISKKDPLDERVLPSQESRRS